jgi:hypothetical protein
MGRAWAAWQVDISQVTSVPDPITTTPLSFSGPGQFTIALPASAR